MTIEPAADAAGVDEAAFRIDVLGPLSATSRGVLVEIPPGLPQRLLALLALRGGRYVSVERVVEDLWNRQPPSRPRDSIYALIRDLRRAFDADDGPILSKRGQGYAIDLGSTASDMVEFRTAAAAAQVALASNDPERAEAALRDALALWRAPQPFPEISHLAAPLAQIAELSELRQWCLRERLGLDLRNGRHAEAVPELRALVKEFPFDQLMWATLMRALGGSGRLQEANDAYQQLRSILRDQFGDEPLPALRDLDYAILSGDPDVVGGVASADLALPAPERSVGPSSVLAPSLNLFVGRAREADQLAATIDTHRLVTVTGPVGVGKTRLVTEVVSDRAAATCEDSYLIDVSARADRAGIIERLGELLGRSDRDLDRLLRLCTEDLRRSPAILVFDGADLNIELTALIALALLEACPSLRVVVTARERLLIPEENIITIGPLPHADAAALFLDRAEASDPTFAPRGDAGEQVVGICAALDGLPLAIELIAPLTSVLALRSIADGLHDHLHLLDVDQRPSTSRHRSLRAAIDWSVERLEPSQRTMLVSISVFPGLFTIDGAATVAAAPVDETTRDLAALVRTSLVTVIRNDGEIQGYQLLETIRAYGRARAVEEGIDQDLSRRHVRHVRTLADVLRRRSPTTARNELIQARLPDHRTAIEWGIRNGADADVLDIVDALQFDLYRLGMPSEVPAWLDAIGDDDGAGDPRAQMVAQSSATCLLFFAGDYGRCRQQGERAIARCRELDEEPRLARTLMFVAAAAAMEGDTEHAVVRAVESRAIGSRLGDRWVEAWSLSFEALAQRRAGDLDESERLAQEALGIFSDLDDQHGCVFPLMTLGRVAEARGDAAGAVELLNGARRLAERLRDTYLIAITLNYLGLLKFRQGDWAGAAADLDRCLQVSRTAPNRITVAGGIEHLAAMGAAQRELELAVRLCGFTRRYRRNIPATQRPEALGQVLDTATLALEQAGRDRLLADGARLSLDEAMELAHGVAGRIRRRLEVR